MCGTAQDPIKMPPAAAVIGPDGMGVGTVMWVGWRCIGRPSRACLRVSATSPARTKPGH